MYIYYIMYIYYYIVYIYICYIICIYIMYILHNVYIYWTKAKNMWGCIKRVKKTVCPDIPRRRTQ